MADWRLGKKSLASKCQLYWDENCESLGDLLFLVGPEEEKIKGFKFPLIRTSPVFEAMFNVTWSSARRQNESIKLPFTDPTIFRHFLRLLLMDDLTITKFTSLNLSLEQVIGIYYLSKEYLVAHLQQTTEAYIKINTQADTVIEIYENVRGKDDEKLELDTFNFMMKNLLEVVQQDEFLTLPKDSLMTILSSISTDVDELSLFQAIWKWAEAQVLDLDDEDEDEKNGKKIVRELVRDFLPKIRLPLLTTRDFATHVRPTGVLDGEEEAALYNHLPSTYDKSVFRLGQTLRLSDSLSVKTGWRSLDHIHWLVLSHVVTSPPPSSEDRSGSGAIWLKTSKMVAFHGVGFLGPLDTDSVYEVEVLMRNGGFPLTPFVRKVVSARKDRIFYITLDTPFTMKAGSWYWILFRLQGPPTGTSVMSKNQEVSQVIQDDLTFEFSRYHTAIAQVLYSPVT